MSRNHGDPASSWWGNTAPPTVVALGAVTWTGIFFTVTAALRIAGFRVYSPGSRTGNRFAMLWNQTDDSIMSVYCWKDGTSPASPSWEQAWCRPWQHCVTGKTYGLAVRNDQDYYRHNAFLGTPVTVGKITFVSSFQSTAIDPMTVSLTTNTNANGVDVLYYSP